MTSPVSQKAIARSNSTVIQAGRDVINGNVFHGRFARLRDVWLDPAMVFREVEVDRFVGREWLVDFVDDFLASHDRGYVVVHGAAGLGKTAFAAWLAKSRDWPCHFTRRRGGRNAVTALRNLAAQLIAAYELGERFAPGGMLPETAGDPGWFDQVLDAAAAKAGNHLVLVVDGLDEAELVEGDLPLGLPVDLPTGVFMVVTSRIGADLRALRLPWKSVHINANDDRNLEDLRRFLSTVTAEPQLRAMLDEKGVQAGDFANQLIDQCGGVWVYLRYVLNELRYNIRGITELANLPVDLASYYLESLVTEDGSWPSVRLPLLATLAAAAEPLPVATLARLAGLPDVSSARALCDGKLRPFLAVTTDEQGTRRYSIYHASLREFLGGATSPHALDNGHAKAEELAQATVQAHARIADHYLPGILADPTVAGTDSGYPRRYLVYHLDHGDRVDDLHRLLAYDKDSRNIWFDVHEGSGGFSEYLTDIRRARSHAMRSGSLDLEIRYAVMTAAVFSLAANVPPPLVERLVATGIWSPGRALNHARQLFNPHAKTRTLMALLPHFDEGVRAGLMSEALTAAREIVDEAARVRALHALAVHRPELFGEVVRVANAVPDMGERTELLRLLAEEAPESSLEAILACAHGISDPALRASLLVALSPRLPQQLLAVALAEARGIQITDDRSWALTRLADQLDEPQRGEVLAEALAAAYATEAAEDRAYALAMLVPHLSSRQAKRVGADACSTARGVADAEERYFALLVVARWANKPELVTEAWRAANAIDDSADRATALREVAADVFKADRAQVLDQALAATDGITDDAARSSALCQVAVELAEPVREQLLAKAVVAARSITNEDLQTDAFSALAPHLPEHLQAEVLDAVGDMRVPYLRAWVLDQLAPHLSTSLVQRALSVTQSIANSRGRPRLLAEVAAMVPDPKRGQVFAEALSAARDIGDPSNRGVVFGELAARAPESQREAVLREALAAVRSESPGFKALGFASLVHRLPEPERERVALEALEVLPQMALHHQMWAVNMLVSHVPEPRRSTILADAFVRVRELSPDYLRIVTTAVLALHLPDPRRQQVLAEVMAAARALPPGSDPAAAAVRTLARFGHRWPTKVSVDLLTALHRAFLSLDEEWQAEAVPRLAKYISFLPRHFVSKALAAIGSIPSLVNPTPMLGALALRLPEEHRDLALRAALTTNRDTTVARRAILQQANLLQDKGSLDLVRRCLDNVGLNDCLSVLAAAVPILHRLGGEELLTSCLETAEAVRRWSLPPHRSSHGQIKA